jgi:hypothetical protein
MKYILASILIVTLSMQYSCSDVSENNTAKRSAQHETKNPVIDNPDMIIFKEIRILVAEYSAMVKDNNSWMTTVTEEKARRGEVKLSVAIN